MFFNCHSLQYLDITNFTTENINNINFFFIYSESLTSLNLSNFKIYNTTNINYIFIRGNQNLTLCYNESKMPSQFLDKVNIYENNCQKLCIMNSKKYILDKEMCIDNCFNETEYKYEYQNICYKECPVRAFLKSNSDYLCEGCPNYYNYEGTECLDSIPEGYYLNSTIEKTIDKCPFKCKICSFESIYNNLCIECNIDDNYYPKLNDESNIELFLQCYNSNEMQKGYYLDNDNNIYKQCYNKCKKCEREGNDENNNCLECLDNFINYNGNCLIKELVSSNIEEELDDNFSYNNENSNIKVLVSSNVEELDDNFIKNKSEMETIKENLINNFNKTEILNGKDKEEVVGENIIITLTTTENQRNNMNSNKTSIDIGDCETKLKDAYNISYNETIYIIKIDVKEEGMKIPKVEYEVYYPLYNDENIKLNLSYCKNSKIDISIPVKIDEDI